MAKTPDSFAAPRGMGAAGRATSGGSVKPKFRKVSRAEAAAPPKGVKNKVEALYSRPISAREAALAKASHRARNKAAGLPSNTGLSKVERAMGSTKRMTLAKAEPRYKAAGTSGAGGYFKRVSEDVVKR